MTNEYLKDINIYNKVYNTIGHLIDNKANIIIIMIIIIIIPIVIVLQIY